MLTSVLCHLFIIWDVKWKVVGARVSLKSHYFFHTDDIKLVNKKIQQHTHTHIRITDSCLFMSLSLFSYLSVINGLFMV